MAKLVNMNGMLNKAVAGHYAVAHININNLEWIKGALAAAQSTNTPIILGVSEGAAKYMCGFKNIVGMVHEVMDFMKVTVPVALHLDHGSYDGAMNALAAGFSSVMFDGSHEAFADNLKKVQEVIAAANKVGASVEAEVIKNGRGKKIKVFHYRPKKKSRKTQGHRQAYTLVEVKKING